MKYSGGEVSSLTLVTLKMCFLSWERKGRTEVWTHEAIRRNHILPSLQCKEIAILHLKFDICDEI